MRTTQMNPDLSDLLAHLGIDLWPTSHGRDWARWDFETGSPVQISYPNGMTLQEQLLDLQERLQ
jgi:hypothetical protein